MAELLDKFAKLEADITKEQVAGEMDRVIKNPDIQKIVQAKTSCAL